MWEKTKLKLKKLTRIWKERETNDKLKEKSYEVFKKWQHQNLETDHIKNDKDERNVKEKNSKLREILTNKTKDIEKTLKIWKQFK